LAGIIPDFTALALFTGNTNLETGKKLYISDIFFPKGVLKFRLFLEIFL
jgi:hypothetical protein